MKKLVYVLVLPLVVVEGFVFANREIKKEPAQQSTSKPVAAAEKKTAREQWEATPDGIRFKQWEESPAGIKVLDGAAKIRTKLNAVTELKATITSLSLPPGSRLGFGVMASIDGTDYIITFEAEKSQLQALKNLKVNDKIILKGRGVSYAPKYAYPIISGDLVEKDGKLIYKRIPPKGGC